MKEIDSAFERVSGAIARTFNLPDSDAIRPETTSADVPGWDSLSHAMLLMELEEEFGINLPLDRAYRAANVGELVELVSEIR